MACPLREDTARRIRKRLSGMCRHGDKTQFGRVRIQCLSRAAGSKGEVLVVGCGGLSPWGPCGSQPQQNLAPYAHCTTLRHHKIIFAKR